MKDILYLVDPKTRTTAEVRPTTFYDLNIKERQDLQAWLMDQPNVLGEPLLLITSEFSRFTKSDRRLDLLFLDANGSLVVAELKLDATRSLADQQAIRYAAFCSTMTMQDVVDQLAIREGVAVDEAVERICSFLQVDELPALNGEPRVILAAGSFNDQELTSTVMWLRKFGVDISCVEITPYRYPGDDRNVLLVPKVLIPLSEAREYQISVERKERKQMERSDSNSVAELFRAIVAEFGEIHSILPCPKPALRTDWMQVKFGHNQIHYEWLVRRRPRVIDVAIHFESPDVPANQRRLEELRTAFKTPALLSAREFVAEQWGRKWCHASYRIPFEGEVPGPVHAKEAAALMSAYIEATLPILKAMD